MLDPASTQQEGADREKAGQLLDVSAGIDAVAEFAAHVGADEIYAIDHEFRFLVPVLAGDKEIEITANMLDAFADHRAVDYCGQKLVPYADDDFPVLVASPARNARITADPDLTGPLFTRLLARVERLEQLRRSSSMSSAAQIQWDQLPVRAVRIAPIRVAGTLAPAYDVAGDLFDIAMHPDGSVGVVALDAMGHGVEAALSAVLALSAIRAARREGASLAEQFDRADQAIEATYAGDRFVTAVALRLTVDSVEIFNAGHEPVRRFGPEGLSEVSVHASPPLGVERHLPNVPAFLPPLQPDELLVITSDGVAGAMNALDRFGTSRIEAALSNHRSAAPFALAHRLARSVREHRDGDLADDATVVVVRRA